MSAYIVIKKVKPLIALSFKGYLGFSRYFQISEFLRKPIYFTISRGNPNDFLRNPRWETLLLDTDKRLTPHKSCRTINLMIRICVVIYTGCPRRKGQYSGRSQYRPF